MFCTLRVCAVVFLEILTPECHFDPISLVLAQRNGVEPPKKGAFFLVSMIAGRTRRWQYLYAGNAEPGEHVRPRRR